MEATTRQPMGHSENHGIQVRTGDLHTGYASYPTPEGATGAGIGASSQRCNRAGTRQIRVFQPHVCDSKEGWGSKSDHKSKETELSFADPALQDGECFLS